MRSLVQRVDRAVVTVAGEVVGEIGAGLLVLVGVTHTDSRREAEKMAEKLWNLRVFEDDAGRMNHSVADRSRALLVVSQFTLYGDASKGRRPSYVGAAPPEQAEPLIEHLVHHLRSHGARVETGRFRAEMSVELVNDGPVTLMLEVGSASG